RGGGASRWVGGNAAEPSALLTEAGMSRTRLRENVCLTRGIVGGGPWLFGMGGGYEGGFAHVNVLGFSPDCPYNYPLETPPPADASPFPPGFLGPSCPHASPRRI